MPLYTYTQHRNIKRTLLKLIQETKLLKLNYQYRKQNVSQLCLNRKINDRNQHNYNYREEKLNKIHLKIKVT